MNCKPGDIAIVIGGGIYAGRLFDVLYAAPATEFKLPDGKTHEGCPPGYWVLKSLGSPVPAPLAWGGSRDTMYGCGPDAGLRPIRGLKEPESIDQEVTA